MSAYEMMLSESQSACSWCCIRKWRPRRGRSSRSWELDFAIVGETIAEDKFQAKCGSGALKADLPLKALSGAAPEYDRPWVPTAPCPAPRRPVAGDPESRR